MENMKRQIKENEIPYRQVAEYGLTREKFLDLPKKALEKIMSGRLSPLFMLRDSQGRQMQAKLTLKRDEQGEVTFMIYPRQKEMDAALYRLQEEEIRRLKDGQTIAKDGSWLQLDRDTNIILQMKMSESRLEKKLDSIISNLDDVQLGTAQRDQIMSGRPVTISRGDTELTVGIDLNTTMGIKVIKGGLDDWRQRMMVEWDRVTPGATGYWQTSENGWEYMSYGRQEREREATREVQRQEHRSRGYSR